MALNHQVTFLLLLFLLSCPSLIVAPPLFATFLSHHRPKSTVSQREQQQQQDQCDPYSSFAAAPVTPLPHKTEPHTTQKARTSKMDDVIRVDIGIHNHFPPHSTHFPRKRKLSDPLFVDDRHHLTARGRGRTYVRVLRMLFYMLMVVVGIVWAQLRRDGPEYGHSSAGLDIGNDAVVLWRESSILSSTYSGGMETGMGMEKSQQSYRFALPLGFDPQSTMYNDRRMMQHYMLTTMRQMMKHYRGYHSSSSDKTADLISSSMQFYFEVFDAGQPIDRLHRPDPEFFFKHYVQQSRPAIITGVVDQWDAYRLWSDEYLARTIGHKEVEIEISRDLRFTGDSKRQRIGKFSVAEFLKRYRAEDTTDRYYLAETSIQEHFPELQKDFPLVPSVISENLYRLDVSQLWIGPGGQITPMHSDDMENLLCQLEGSRKIVLFDPYQSDLLYIRPDNEVYTDFDPDKPDFERYPLSQFARPVHAEMKSGEMLFLPSYWYHLVKSQAGRSLAVNYWYSPISEVQGLSRLTLLSPRWRDPNDPSSKFEVGRKRKD